MNQLPEEFNWDAILISLHCENKHLLNALTPLKLNELETLDKTTSILPTILKQNLSYKQRLDFEKKIEHLPLSIFWTPTSSSSLLHFKFWAKKNFDTEWLFQFAHNESAIQETLINEFSTFKSLYEVVSNDSQKNTDLIGLSQFTENACFSREEVLQLVANAQESLNKMISWVWLKNSQVSPISIEFINQQQPIELEPEYFINLADAKTLSEDFHIIMPDKLIRIIYANSLQLKRNDALARLDANNFPQEIFKMPTSIFNNWNQWAKVKSLENWCLKITNDSPPHSPLSINNKASGSGVMISWKLEQKSLPLYRIKTFFSTEMAEILVRTKYNDSTHN